MELSRDPRTPTAMATPAVVVDDSACDVDDLAPCGGVLVTVPGEEPWDALVTLAVESGWPGVELLPGAAGTVADAVRVNAAAHGQAVADTVAAVRTWDRTQEAQRTFAWGDCGFGPGSSRFLEEGPDGRDRYEILDVRFQFRLGDLTAPLRDEELTRRLGVPHGARVQLGAAREAALRARAGGGGRGQARP